jgi:hypothetical protein
MKLKGYKAVISGSYLGHDDIRYDYSGVEGYVPPCEEDAARAAIVSRYAQMWVTGNGKSIKSIRNVFIDLLEEAEHDFSLIGKDVRNLTYEELQDLAVLKGLRGIPLYKKQSLRESILIAYGLYAKNVMNIDVDVKSASFELNKAEKAIVTAKPENHIYPPKDGEPYHELEDLIEIAKSRGIKIKKPVSKDELYKRLFVA